MYFCGFKSKEMSETKGPSKRVKQLIADLFLEDDKKVIKTLTILEAEGKPEVLRPICEAYMKSKSDKVKDKMEQFLNKLSDSSAAPELVELLRDEELLSMRRILLGACWQSKLDMTPYIADFVAIACEGDFLEVFECATIIDNLEGPFEESHILECQLYLKEFLENDKGKNEQIDQLVSDIAILIKDFDRAIQG